MTWTALTYSFGSTLTSAKMTQNQDNFTALANGDSGAPSIQTAAIANAAITLAKMASNSVDTSQINANCVTQAKMANSSIGQAQLKTTTTSSTVTAGSVGAKSYTLTGGGYSWYTITGSTGGGTGPIIGGGSGSLGTVGWYANDNADAVTMYERYVQASPPYRLGPLFVFLLMNSDGTFNGIYPMPDPPWAYHGPTDIRPDFFTADGKPMKRIAMIDGIPFRQALKNKLIRKDFINNDIAVTYDFAEITQDYKDSDINVMPHPFLDPLLPGQTVVMLEPGTRLMQKLSMMMDMDQSAEVLDLIKSGGLIIDNTPLTIPNAPPRVMVVRSRLKLS